MDGVNIVSLFAIGISAGSFLVSFFSFRQKAESSFVDQLQTRISDLERRMAECEEARSDLLKKNQEMADENLRLLREIVNTKVIKNKNL